MCCILYYIYLKYRDYFKKEPKQEENKKEENKRASRQPTLQELAEYRFNARRLNEYVRNKDRSYFINYD